MSIIQGILLGILQGVTEFLPVSSSGHLAILQKIFAIDESTLLFDVALHTGTLISVFVVLRAEIWELLKKPIQKLTGLLLLSTAITAIFAIPLQKIKLFGMEYSLLESASRSTIFLGIAFLVTSLALFIAEKLSARQMRAQTEMRDGAKLNIADALTIGLCQGFGVLPGISRSGSTLAGALGRGIERGTAARYSFLLSIPAILGALVLELKDTFEVPADGAASIGIAPTLAGAFTAAIVGFFAVRVMLKLVQTKKLYGFSIYTAILGIAVLFDTCVTKVFF
jgi:undecaprenyl-diphosphatase